MDFPVLKVCVVKKDWQGSLDYQETRVLQVYQDLKDSREKRG